MSVLEENLTVEDVRTKMYKIYLVVMSVMLMLMFSFNIYDEYYDKAVADVVVLVVMAYGYRYYTRTGKFERVIDAMLVVVSFIMMLLLLFSHSTYNTVLYLFYLIVPLIFMFFSFKKALIRLSILSLTLFLVFVLYVLNVVELNVNIHQYSVFLISFAILVAFTSTPIYYFYDLKDRYVKKSNELEQQKLMFEALFEKSRDGILILENHKFVDCNDAILSILKYDSKEKLLNTHPSELSPPFQPDGKNSYEKSKEMIAICQEKGIHRFDWLHKKADGEIFWCEIVLSKIELQNKSLIHVLWRDITQRKMLELELTTLATTDTLTGINNRRNFFTLAEKMFEKKEKNIFVAMIDIDNFKQINDKYGHAAGDKVLINCTEKISSIIDSETLLGRLGGEEFGIVTCKENFEEANRYIESIRLEVNKKLCHFGENAIEVSVSIGFSQMQEEDDGLDYLLSEADRALYEAKKSGKNRVMYRS